MNDSKLTKNQTKTFGPVPFTEKGYAKGATITATVRYDDSCGNGHNSFAITADVDEPMRWAGGGCMHKEVAKYFPELAPLLRFHLMSSDEPMHYIANTLYWLGYSGFCDGKSNSPPNLANARESACWPEMPESFLAPANLFGPAEAQNAVVNELNERLPGLQAEFRKAVESMGFTF